MQALNHCRKFSQDFHKHIYTHIPTHMHAYTHTQTDTHKQTHTDRHTHTHIIIHTLTTLSKHALNNNIYLLRLYAYNSLIRPMYSRFNNAIQYITQCNT